MWRQRSRGGLILALAADWAGQGDVMWVGGNGHLEDWDGLGGLDAKLLIPEPSTFLLAVLGLLGMLGLRRRRR